MNSKEQSWIYQFPYAVINNKTKWAIPVPHVQTAWSSDIRPNKSLHLSYEIITISIAKFFYSSIFYRFQACFSVALQYKQYIKGAQLFLNQYLHI